MEHNRKRIAVNSIMLDHENARHGVRSTQKEILEWMVSEDVREKVVNLAKEIAKQGPSPIDLPIVIPTGSAKGPKYLVVEGNRRIASLKMLKNPEKCPDKKVRSQFQKLKETALVELPRSLLCAVFPDVASAEYWIKIRHGGENNGAGTVNWGPREFDGFERRMGRTSPNRAAANLIDYALSERLVTKEETDKIPITNITRLLGTRGVRSLLGVDISKGEVFRTAEKEYFDRAIGAVFSELSSGQWPVTNLKTKEQRIKFISDLRGEQSWGSYDPISPEKIDGKVENDNPDVDADPVNKPSEPRVKSKPHSLNRRYVVPPGVVVHIKHRRLNDIFLELKNLEAKHVNAAAALTRIFIEGCTDCYLKSHGEEVRYNDKLSAKVQKAKSIIVEKNNSSHQVKQDLKGYEMVAGSHNSLASSDTLNATMHNMSFSLSPNEVKSIWNNLVHALKWFEGDI